MRPTTKSKRYADVNVAARQSGYIERQRPRRATKSREREHKTLAITTATSVKLPIEQVIDKKEKKQK